MKKILKDNHAQGGVITFFIGVMLAVVIGINVAWPVMDSAINSGNGAYATLTFTGNTWCGQMVNVTPSPGASTIHFYINVSGLGCAVPNAGFAVVTMTTPHNTSTASATNLTTAINANASISGTMTATNPSAGVIQLNYNTHGAAGNNAGVVLAESVTNATWSGTTLSGGVSDASTMPTAASTIVAQLPLFLVLVLLMVLVKALI